MFVADGKFTSWRMAWDRASGLSSPMYLAVGTGDPSTLPCGSYANFKGGVREWWRKWMLYVRPTKFVIELLFKVQKYHVQLLSMISSSVRARQEVDGFLWLLNPQMWTYHVSTDTDRVTGVKEPPTSIQVSLGTKDSPITVWRVWAVTVQWKTHIEWNVSGDLFFFGTFSH
jgi:hypothetical protein